MGHYAEIGENNQVLRVIIADQDFIDNMPGTWVKTSYNTAEGEHKKGGIPLRKNFAGPGYTYDPSLDAFIPPKPFKSWKLDQEKGVYMAPKKRPGKDYLWNEKKLKWERSNGRNSAKGKR